MSRVKIVGCVPGTCQCIGCCNINHGPSQKKCDGCNKRQLRPCTVFTFTEWQEYEIQKRKVSELNKQKAGEF
jgi:hypothetical protein